MERVPEPVLGADRSRQLLTIEVWTRNGLRRFMVLFFVELSTRNVEIAGIAAAANGYCGGRKWLWMSQVAKVVYAPPRVAASAALARSVSI